MFVTSFIAVILNLGSFCTPGNVWQYLETLLFVTVGMKVGGGSTAVICV
jgi:hypothetical protein